MSRAKPHLKALEARRRLLVAESEMNRAGLLGELKSMDIQVAALTQQARSYGTLFFKGLSICTALIVLRRVLPGKATGKSSWLSSLISGARMAISLWFAVCGRH